MFDPLVHFLFRFEFIFVWYIHTNSYTSISLCSWSFFKLFLIPGLGLLCFNSMLAVFTYQIKIRWIKIVKLWIYTGWCVRKTRKKYNKFKIQNRKKNDKLNEKNVHSGTNRDGNLTTYLKTLSQLIGALFWCDSSAKILLRSWTLCLKFQIQISNI